MESSPANGTETTWKSPSAAVRPAIEWKAYSTDGERFDGEKR